MKKHLCTLLAVCLLFACRKAGQSPISSDPYNVVVQRALQDSLSPTDYAGLDFSHAQEIHVDSTHLYLVRVPFSGKDMATDFLLVKTDLNGHPLKGTIVHLDMATASRGKTAFSGSIAYRSLRGEQGPQYAIRKGKIQLPSIPIMLNKEADPIDDDGGMDGGELPEVIVFSSYAEGGISWSQWYNLLAMLNAYGGGGGGSYGGGNYYSPGGGGEAPAVQVDFEAWANQVAIDVAKFLKCFASLSATNATYSLSIASDIPVDNDPSVFFNWADQSPGHAFVTLTMNSGGTSISQMMGFYPSSPTKATTGNFTQGIVSDNGGHEFNAQYTIPVTAAQFQSAMNAVTLYSSFQYIINSFNCTDFALQVFNLGGGNLTIPTYQIPGYGSANGSNTPQGLYNAIKALQDGGNPAANAGSGKQYSGSSHGACN